MKTYDEIYESLEHIDPDSLEHAYLMARMENPLVGDQVLFTVSTSTGSVIGTYAGKVIKISYGSLGRMFHVITAAGDSYEVIPKHSKGMYSGDHILGIPQLGELQDSKFSTKCTEPSEHVLGEEQYYMVLNKLTNRLVLESANKYKQDTIDYLKNILGENEYNVVVIAKIQYTHAV